MADEGGGVINNDLLGMLTQFTLSSTVGGMGTLGAALSTLGSSIKPNTIP